METDNLEEKDLSTEEKEDIEKEEEKKVENGVHNYSAFT